MKTSYNQHPSPSGRGLAGPFGTGALKTIKTKRKDISGAVVSRLDYCAGYPGSIPAGPVTEFPTGIQFWVMTYCFQKY